MRRAVIYDSELRFQSLVESVRDWIWEVDAEGVYTYSNPAVKDVLGYEPEEVIGKTPFDFMPPDEARRLSGEFENILLEKRSFERLENINITKDGRSVVLETSGTPILDEQGLLIGYRGVDRDISDRKQAEEELRKSESRLKAILDNIPDMVWMKDVYGRYIAVNGPFADACGFDPASLAGKTDLDVWPGELAERYMADDREVMETGRRKSVEEPLFVKSGKELCIETIKSPIYGDSGRVVGTVGIAHDITERKALERQRDDFYAMVTHDIRSPLVAVLGYSEMLMSARAEEAGAMAKDVAPGIYRSGRKVLDMVEDFLAVSRLEHGKLAVNATMTDVPGLLSAVGSEVAQAVKDEGIEYEDSVSDNVKTVLLDRRLVERAVLNLLRNAVNYTPRGGRITLDADKVLEHGQELLVVSVTDTGRGIPAEDQGRIFEKYFRSTSSRGVKGTGLGLYIVKAVAEAHGGRVTVESEKSKGSTFKIYLPVHTEPKMPQ